MTSIADLPASVLHELAAIAEHRQQENSPWRQLTPEELEEGVAMLAAGTPPGFGWWRQHLPPPQTTPDWPPIPSRQPWRTWEPWELIAAAVDMSDDHVPLDDAKAVLAELAADHHLDAHTLKDAYIALGVTV